MQKHPRPLDRNAVVRRRMSASVAPSYGRERGKGRPTVAPHLTCCDRGGQQERDIACGPLCCCGQLFFTPMVSSTGTYI